MSPKEARMDENVTQESRSESAGEMTIEEIELEWWQPLGCACDVEVDE
jgi:hypothetical protein